MNEGDSLIRDRIRHMMLACACQGEYDVCLRILSIIHLFQLQERSFFSPEDEKIEKELYVESYQSNSSHFFL
jgi:hypothetical protein